MASVWSSWCVFGLPVRICHGIVFTPHVGPVDLISLREEKCQLGLMKLTFLIRLDAVTPSGVVFAV